MVEHFTTETLRHEFLSRMHSHFNWLGNLRRGFQSPELLGLEVGDMLHLNKDNWGLDYYDKGALILFMSENVWVIAQTTEGFGGGRRVRDLVVRAIIGPGNYRIKL